MRYLLQALTFSKHIADRRKFHFVLIVLISGCISQFGEFPAFANKTYLAPSREPLPRATSDRRHGSPGDVIHIMYVLPSDGEDRHLDSNGQITLSVAAAQRWFMAQTSDTLSLRFDMFEGRLDVTFFRLSRTDRELAKHGVYVRDEIETELKAAKFDEPQKIYLVYYDGSSTVSCGAAAPSAGVGRIAALYLKGTPPGALPCSHNDFAESEVSPGYWEFSLLHEILHMLGAVDACAPHHTRAGHVSDDNRDLMYAGKLRWNPSILDVGNDDYFGHKNGSCVDIAKSNYLEKK